MAATGTVIPQYPPFDCSGEGVAVRWNKWISRLRDNIFVAYNITDDTRQKALMLTLAGDELNDIFDGLPVADKTPREGQANDTHFGRAADALTAYFNPKQNNEYQRYVFRHSTQNQGETADQYHHRLTSLAVTCQFHDVDQEVKSQLIAGATDDKVTKKGLSDPDLSLKNLLQYMKSLEITEQQNQQMKSDRSDKQYSDSVNFVKNTHTKQSSKRHDSQVNHTSRNSTKCRNCGQQWPHEGGLQACPANGVECHRCHRRNHFAAHCRSTVKRPDRKYSTQLQSHSAQSQNKKHRTESDYRHKRKPKGKINQVSGQKLQVTHDFTDSSDSDIDYVCAINSARRDSLPHTTVLVNEQPITFVVDTGATTDIIDESTWNSMQPRPALDSNTDRLSTYSGDSLKVLGSFKGTLSHNHKTIHRRIRVVSRDAGCLLGYESAIKLDIVHMSPTVNKVTTEPDHLFQQYPKLFSGVGLLKDTTIKLHIDETVKPIAVPHRRVPFHIRHKVEEKLQELEEADIIEHVTGPTPWVSPIVTPPKPHNPDEIRLCVDMRGPNTAIKRERHITPTIEDILSDLNGSTVFSKLDLNQGYHQILLDEESRYITTFSTHVGLRRYKRLNFGISCASEIFQNTIRNVLAGLEGTLNVSDDILVYGQNIDQHNERLHAALTRLQERGLTLNKEKCEFARTTLTYLGYRFSADGISPDPAKIKAVTNIAKPTNATEVRSLLGLANYCARFIPNFATITSPLRELTRKNTAWKWTAAHDDALETIKEALTSNPVMTYFDPAKQTEVVVDASPVGLGAILTQRSGQNVKVISYASRALTPVEQRYSQTEREALAIVFGCEKFHLYLYGNHAKVFTDHRPLVPMFNNPRSTLPARIERWILRLQQYDIQVIYRPGKDNPADYASRHPTDSVTCSRAEKVAEQYINFLASTSDPSAIKLHDIQKHTRTDPLLQSVIAAVESGDWISVSPEFRKLSSELSATSDRSMLLRGHRIVLPQKLQQSAVDLSHEGHQGMSKSKMLLRSRVWFPNMDKLVENTISQCLACQANTPSNTYAPVTSTELPDSPWQNVDVDFFGPLPSGDYLCVFIDEYSRFPVVEIIHSLTAKTIIPMMDKVFSVFGIPVSVKSDNGPPFNSAEFANFAEHSGFQHHRVTPLWPQANGEVERFMRNLGKCVKTALTERRSYKQALHAFLRNYRTTPHCTTGVTPAMLMFGRETRNKLPSLTTKLNDRKFQECDKRNKMRTKQYIDLKRRARSPDFNIGDKVLVKQPKHNKFTSIYNPVPYTIVKLRGTQITAQNARHRITRNVSHFKHFKQRITPQMTNTDKLLQQPDVRKSRELNFDFTVPPPDDPIIIHPIAPDPDDANVQPVVNQGIVPAADGMQNIAQPQTQITSRTGRPITTPAYLKDNYDLKR